MSALAVLLDPTLSRHSVSPKTGRIRENTAPDVIWPHWHSRQESQSVSEENVDSDQTLIRAAQRNSEQSFAKLIARYESAVAGILWHFTRDRLVLEELVQDTFVEAYFSLNRFHDDAPFFPWLRTITTRVGYRHWRLLRRERLRAQLRETQMRMEPTTKTPSDVAEYVFHTLEQLAPKDRLVLTLQYFEGCSVADIAERMGWSQTLVKVRAFRARAKLRALLEAEVQS